MSSHNILGTDSEEETILADYYMQESFVNYWTNFDYWYVDHWNYN